MINHLPKPSKIAIVLDNSRYAIQPYQWGGRPLQTFGEENTPKKLTAFLIGCLWHLRVWLVICMVKPTLRISLADTSQLSWNAFPNLYSQMQAMIVKYSMRIKWCNKEPKWKKYSIFFVLSSLVSKLLGCK